MYEFCNSCGRWEWLGRYSTMCADCADTWTDNVRAIKAQIEALIS
jgi:hypothetical protein